MSLVLGHNQGCTVNILTVMRIGYPACMLPQSKKQWRTLPKGLIMLSKIFEDSAPPCGRGCGAGSKARFKAGFYTRFMAGFKAGFYTGFMSGF